MAERLILSELNFANKSAAFLKSQLTVLQFAMGWLGELEAKDLMDELEAEVDLWLQELHSESEGLLDTTVFRRELIKILHSIDIEELKRESIEQAPKTEAEWLEKYSRIDNLPANKVADYILEEIGHEAAKEIRERFPKSAWPEGGYEENGTLTGLAFFLFTQGVGRNRKVKSGNQSSRRKGLRSQFHDCQHIEAAARCTFFLSNDRGAVKLAQAAYAYAGVSTIAERLWSHGTQ